MRDSYGREIDYMRVSVTDRCNLRCKYCMPNGIEWIPRDRILTYEQILLVCESAAMAGIRKLKVTGGEALVRPGSLQLMEKLKKIEGISQVTLTTNGILLEQYAKKLKDIGLEGVNISLDSLKREGYREITGTDGLDLVEKGIEAAVQAGLRVKINSVLLRGINEKEWLSLAELAKDMPIDVRFIEMMPIGYGKNYEVVSNSEIQQELKRKYPDIRPDSQMHGNGPAVYYHITGYQGSIGFISAIHGKFCDTCNRIRLTSTGEIKPCLCYGDMVDLKPVLFDCEKKREEQKHCLTKLIKKAIHSKPQSHCFEEGLKITEEKQMVRIGG